MALLAIIALLASAGVVQSHQTQVAPGDAFTPPSVLMERVTFLSGKIGVFVQVGTGEVWPDMEQCLSNVFAASNDRIGVHIDYVEASAPSQAVMHQLSGYMRGKHGYVNLVLTKSASKGMDMGHFASQLYYAQNKGLHYDFLLKIHTDSMPEIRNLALQALCGTKFQVRSVLHNFNAHGHLNLIAPVGTTMTRRTKVTNLAPVLGDRLFGGHAEVGGSFLYSTKQATKQFLSAMESDIKVSEDQLTSIGGNMYWARFNAVPFGGLAKALPSIWPKLEGVEVELGNFAVSALRGAGGYVGELPMAPKVMAIYFPQYHQFPENDEFHGEGFTEWTHLKPFVDETNELRKPLSSEKGGLDYYDLTQRDVRKRQAELADQYGVYGFMIYHYWFNGQNVKNSSVMWKIPHLMLQDGQPDKPFFFSWANRRWERGYGEHATGEVLIEQDYANETGWKEHFNYLLPYFQHRNYKKMNNKPVFAIYFPQEIGEKLAPMMNNWHLLAKQNGFGGIYFLRTVSGAGGPSFMPSLFDASFHFMAVCERCGRPASGEDKDFITTWPQYWGATTGFDNRVRGCSQRYRASPEEFKTGLIESFRNMSHTPNRRINENLYFIAAWNEWNEQGVLEPDHLHSFAYLKALQDAVETIQAADPIKRDREEAAKTSLLETSEAGHPRDEDAVHLLQVRPDLAWGYATGPHRWNETVHDRIRAMERLRQAGMLSSGPSTDAKNVTSDLAGSPYYRRDDGRKGRGRDDRARDDGRGRGRDDGRRVDDDRRGRRGSRDDRHMDDSHRGDDRRGGRGDDRRGDDDRRGRRGDDHRVDDDHRGGRDDRRGDDDRHGGRDDRHGDDGNRTRDDDRRGGRDDRRGDDDRRGGRDDRRGDDDRRGGRDDRRGDDDRRGGRDDRRGDDGNRTRDDDRRGGRDDRRGDDDRRGGSRGNRRGDDDRRGGRGDDDRRGGRGDDDRRGGRGDDDRRGGRGDDDRRGGGDDRRGGRGGDDRRRDDDGRGGGRDDDGRRGGRDDDGRGGGRDDDGRRGGRDDDGRGGGRDDDGNGGGNGGGGNGGGGNGGGGNGGGGNGDGGNGGRDDDGSRPGDWDWEYVPI